MVTGTLEEGHTLVIFPEDLAFRTIAALSTFLLTRKVHGDFAARPLTRRAADLVHLSLNGTNCTTLRHDVGIHPFDNDPLSSTVMYVSSNGTTQALGSLLTPAHVKHTTGDIPISRVHSVVTFGERSVQESVTQLLRGGLSLNLHLARML